MNSKSLILLLPALTSPLFAAPIDLGPGTTVYSQNFDTLPNTVHNNLASAAWADDSTLPGWYLYRTGTAAAPLSFAGASLPYYVADGAVAPTTAPLAHAFYSFGSSGSTDRCLGSTSTTAQGEQSAIVLFHNTTANPVRLTHVKFSVEAYRQNSTTNNKDSLFMWYRTAPTVAAANTMTTAAATATVFPAAVSTGPASLYVTGWTPVDQFRHTQSDPSITQIDPARVVPFDAAPVAPIVVPAGQILSVRWSNINDGGADAMMGIDDLTFTFSETSANLTSSVSGIVRDPGPLPGDPSDDTVSFDLTVSATGAASPLGWRIPASSPIASGTTGTYGTPLHFTRPFTDFVTGAGILTFPVEDAADANSGIPVAVTAPKFIPQVTATFSPGITFTPATAGVNSFTNALTTFTDLGWSNTTTTSLVEVQPTVAAGNKYFKHTGAVAVMTSDPVSLSALGGQAVELEAGLSLYTLSNSGLENDDKFSLNLEVALDGDFANTANGNVVTGLVTGIDGVTAPLGAAYGDSIAATTAPPSYINLGASGYTATPFIFHKFKKAIAVPVASAATARARMVFSSIAGITSEHLLLDDVVFRAAAGALNISAPTGITRNLNGPGVSDDTVSFSLDISGVGVSGQWNATGALPATGAYGNSILFTAPAGPNVNLASVTIVDSVNPALTATASVAFDPVYLIGSVDFGAGVQDLASIPLPATDREWKNTPAARTTTLNTAVASATVKTFTSETVNLSGVSGAFVTLTLALEDHSSGFEAADHFELKAILNGDTLNPVNLVTNNTAGSYDDGSPLFPIATVAGDGILSGGELVPSGAYTALAPFTRDYLFRYAFPVGTTSAYIVVSSTNDSASEFLTIKNFNFGQSNVSDADGDGMEDSYEDANGLDKTDASDKLTDLDGDGQNNYAEFLAGTAANDPNSTLRITAAGMSPTGEISLTWTSVPGKHYRARVSTDLGVANAWTNLGSTVTATGTSTSIPAGNIVPPGLFSRYFMRVEVQP